MRIATTLLTGVAALGLITGCAGPEKKLGRGLSNMTEFARLGEMQRSVEQTGLWDGADRAYTTGVVRGFNRSMARTFLGVYEVVTFPFPSYEPLLAKGKVYPDPSIKTKSYPYGGLVLPDRQMYPASYRPGLPANTTFSTDASLGFSGGDVAPSIPGSRFRIFDN